MKAKIRITEMNRRRKRRAKIAKLRRRYLEAKSVSEWNKVIEKAMRINPYLTPEEFLRPLDNKK